MFKRIVRNLIAVCYLIHLTSSQYCNYYEHVQVGATHYIRSPNYPANYYANSYCKWVYDSPVGTTMHLDCHKVQIPQSKGCLGDHLTVSFNRELGLSNGHRYCGYGSFSVQSHDNHLATSLSAGIFSEGGRFICSLQAINTCDCGWSQKPRIVGGTETGVNEYPMMAGLVDLHLRIIYCGSTIISSRFVLTAAHCLVDREPSLIAVIVGEHDYSTGNDTSATKLILVDWFTLHPDYNKKLLTNDIGLVRLSAELKFNRNIGPACLPIRFSDNTFQGELVTILGWGTTDFGGPLSKRLMQARLKVIPLEECASKLKDTNISEKNLCTYAVNKDACQSDSGGPVLWQDQSTGRYQLLGVISNGIGCASDFPGVNTRVGAYIDWIKTTTRKDDYCLK